MTHEGGADLAAILYPPTLDWHRMVQRPHLLLWEAARAGHVVIWCDATQRADRAMDRVTERFSVCHNFNALLRAELPRPLVLYHTDPGHVQLAPRLRPDRTVFDAVDDLPALRAGWPAACGVAGEVWCASQELQRRIAPLRSDAVWVPNGADLEGWSQASGGAEPLGAAVLPHPRVLVLGRMGDWVDWDALRAAADELPEAHLLVAGTVETAGFFRADGAANIHCLGERPYARLADYARACDAAVIAYRADHPAAAAADPLKLWNLLAAGVPVVASGLPAADEVGEAVWIAPPGGLGATLREVLSASPRADRADRVERGRALAARRPWSASWRLAAARWKGAAA